MFFYLKQSTCTFSVSLCVCVWVRLCRVFVWQLSFVTQSFTFCIKCITMENYSEPPFVCVCKQTFGQKQLYIDHVRQCTFFKGILDPNMHIICAICRKTISSAKYFIKTHVNFHEGISWLHIFIKIIKYCWFFCLI